MSAMRQISLILTFGVFGLLASGPAHAQLYRCMGPDGNVMFTNKIDKTGGLTDCKEYIPESTLGVLPPPSKGEAPALEGYPYERPPAPRAERPEDRRLAGQISFETFRMLSTGMSETEVLVRAGPPRHRFRLSIGTIVWAYANDDWIVEVTFSGGRVAEINRYRPRP